MRSMLISFRQFISQISRDSMLIVISLSPVITGIFFKFGIVLVEKFLCEYFGKATILSPYYLLVDIFLAVITPYMFCFVSAMVMLEERDTGITNYLSVTPVGKSGYLMSRLGFPTIISIVYSGIVLSLFSLSPMNTIKTICLCVLAAPMGTVIALLIVSLSANKVEGMAFAKIGGLIMLGVAIPFFITGTEQYYGAFLPSFWIAKSMLDFGAFNLIMSIVVIVLWINVLSRMFNRKIN